MSSGVPFGMVTPREAIKEQVRAWKKERFSLPQDTQLLKIRSKARKSANRSSLAVSRRARKSAGISTDVPRCMDRA